MENPLSKRIQEFISNDKKTIELTSKELDVLFRVAQLTTLLEMLTEPENNNKQKTIETSEKELEEIFQNSGLKDFIKLYFVN